MSGERNAFHKASRQTQRGLEGEIKAFVIPAQQHDPLTKEKLVANQTYARKEAYAIPGGEEAQT